MVNKIRVLFVTHSKLQHYRIPIFRIVNNTPNIELTLAHCGDKIVQKEIPEILLKKKKFGSFYFIKDYKKTCQNYDVILCMFYYNNLSILKSLICKSKRIVLWSIGVPASYNRNYGEASSFRYKLLNFFQKRANALLLYTDSPLQLYKERGIKIEEKKIFIANNTVEVIKQEVQNEQKTSLLFIGTLYLEKGLLLLLKAYKEALSECSDMIPLNIVGGGSQFNDVQQWIKENGISNKVNMLGPIYDPSEKAEIFRKSIACVSPMQAGLSVLESMGYGVPFITSENAITGGEAFNIVDGENGLRLNNISMLKDVLIDICHNKGKYLAMGRNAYDYYWSHRTSDVMAKGIVSAINYAYKN